MTKVKIEPGICGFTTVVTADTNEDEDVTVKVASGCASVKKMMEDLGDTFDGIDLCLKKPGTGVFYDYAQEHFPVHAACPIINGILKCIEAESQLALKKDCSITFID
jgi:hypothetical protein